MESIKIQGTVVRVKDVETFGSGFTKQTIVISDTSDKCEQQFAVERMKDNIEKVASVKEGDELSVEANLQGREWTGNDKWFVSLAGWKVNSHTSKGATPAPPAFDPADEVLDEEPPF